MRMKLGDYRFHRELCSQSGLWLSGLINKAVFPLSFSSMWVHVVEGGVFLPKGSGQEAMNRCTQLAGWKVIWVCVKGDWYVTLEL